ncbi:IucA/IucC family protein [Streptomyces sp. NPDC003860]
MSLSAPASLTAATWQEAGRRLLAKALAEFSYEGMLTPEEDSSRETGAPGSARAYRLRLQDGPEYRFRARRGAFGSWHVEPESVVRAHDGTSTPADCPLRFVRDAQHALGIPGDTAGHLVRELSTTLVADARLLATADLTAAELADLPYARLEGHQTGHPWVVPNKGRLGFSAGDAARYAPEARQPLRLPWIAVHRSIAEYRAVPGLPVEQLVQEELDAETRERFAHVLTARGLAPADFLWLPVHPWQWDQIVVPVFAEDVAKDRIVPLGDGPDRYLPQQSIRTFSNVDELHRRHVKLPLSIFNTLVWRGLPTERTLAAPAVTQWVLGLHADDPYLHRDTRVVLLGEVASVTVEHRILEDVPGVPYQYQELLGAIWRESLPTKLDEGERARTLASLLHVDGTGRPFAAELVERSGLSADEWLRRLFHAVLPPLLHFLYRYGVVFSPHGENAIVVFDENEAPARLAVKDFVDDVNVCAGHFPELESMPDDVAAVLLKEEPGMLRHHIVTGLFVGHFRYLSDLFEQHVKVSETEFWELLRSEICAYQEKFPDLSERFDLFDLFCPEFERFCLNRNRLLVDAYRDRDDRPHTARNGTVPNPLYRP